MGIWVQAFVDGSENAANSSRKYYFWDTETRNTEWQLPDGEECVWVSQKTQDGKQYFWNTRTRETTWSPPSRDISAPPVPSTANGAATSAALGGAEAARAATAAGAAPGANAVREAVAGGAKAATASEFPRPRAASSTTFLPPPPEPAQATPSPGSSAEAKSWTFEEWYRGSGVPPRGHSGRPSSHAQAASASSSASSSGSAWLNGGGTGEWVEVVAEDGQTYYWNLHRKISVRTLPKDVPVRWRHYRTPERDGFFVDIQSGQAQWTILDAPLASSVEEVLGCVAGAGVGGDAKWIQPRAALVVAGLRRGARFNEQTVEVVGFEDGRVIVKLPDCLGGHLLGTSPRNLRPLPEGTVVELRNLSNAALNGQVGTIAMRELDRCKYHVKLRDDSTKIVGCTKLLARSRLWDVELSPAHQGFLKWRGEQNCLFIDSKGFHRKFALHLPLDFQTYQQEAGIYDRQCSWPMLLYLHGTGGSSFFHHSKKTLKSVGMNHAASKFVVVSPMCDWNWKEVPKPWVRELVLALRAASWVDHSRIYVSGCSMGGMSTWEVGADKPDLYAAIAPVAGHHQEQRQAWIASKLLDTPICVVHSMMDETCHWQKEEPLWKKIAQENDQFELQKARGIDHCSMFEKTYCDDGFVFDWLLRFQRKDGGV